MKRDIVFDIGGSHMRVGAVWDGALQQGILTEETPKDFDEGIALLKEMIVLQSHSQPIGVIAGGVAGPLNPSKLGMSNSPNLPGWVGKPIVSSLATLAGAVYLENDTALCGLGEATHGAGVGHRIVAYLTLSTGVGGVRIVDRKIDISALGFEPGHQIVDINGTWSCVDGSTCLARTVDEQLSGNGILRRYQKRADDIVDQKFWEEYVRVLAAGINNTIVYWSPHVVVLGGPLAQRISLPLLTGYVRGMVTIFPQLPQIVLAHEPGINGLLGATELIRTRAK